MARNLAAALFRRGGSGEGQTPAPEPLEPGAIGLHLLADLYGVQPEWLADAALLREILDRAVARSGLQAAAEPVVIEFAPAGEGGVTGFVVLAESHIAFHSYPEHQYLAVDLFTCGPKAAPQAALNVFIEALHPARSVVHRHARGKHTEDPGTPPGPQRRFA